ncbi:hypothetical protein SAMN04488514_103234 [Kriegella aquimaris]|uniref:Uncharacterized protein n=1 Tax=Kriegella aquimaris TaxID=192904 RepID=A0A1G9NLC2_9FLAO|nr:hypothetical protein SAMN04488514_103234 [Kriegella aquimaris]
MSDKIKSVISKSGNLPILTYNPLNQLAVIYLLTPYIKKLDKA